MPAPSPSLMATLLGLSPSTSSSITLGPPSPLIYILAFPLSLILLSSLISGRITPSRYFSGKSLSSITLIVFSRLDPGVEIKLKVESASILARPEILGYEKVFEFRFGKNTFPFRPTRNPKGQTRNPTGQTRNPFCPIRNPIGSIKNLTGFINFFTGSINFSTGFINFFRGSINFKGGFIKFLRGFINLFSGFINVSTGKTRGRRGLINNPGGLASKIKLRNR